MRTICLLLLGCCLLWGVPATAASRIVFISGGQLYSINPDGSSLTKLTSDGARDPVASRDGQFVAFISAGGISVLNTATAVIRKIPLPGTIDILRGFTPDNRRIYYARYEKTGVKATTPAEYNVDFDGRNERKSPSCASFFSTDSLSADAKWLLAPDNTHIALISLDGKQEKSVPLGKVMDDYGELADPVFCPDSTHIAFCLTTSGDYEHGDLYTIKLDGTMLKCLVKIQDGKHDAVDSAMSPHYSSDGKWIAFEGWDMWGPDPDKETRVNLCIVRANGGGRRRLTVLDKNSPQYTFSPDSKSLVFVKGGDIWTINIDGTGLRQLTKKHHNSNPCWLPIR